MKLYSNSPYEEFAFDDHGVAWERFFGADFYHFECEACGQTKANGWITIRRSAGKRQVCSDCVQMEYDHEI